MRSYSSSRTEKGDLARIPLVAALFVVVGALCMTRLFYLQVFRNSNYVALAAAQHSLKDTIPAKRGQIFATDSISKSNSLLASNQSLNLLYVDPKEIKDKDEVFEKLAPILGKQATELASKYDPDSRYIILAHKLTNDQSSAVESLKLKGVGLQKENWRFYPEGALAAAVLGFVNNQGVGNYGLEQHYDGILKGEDGYLNEETDAHGIEITFGKNVSKSAVNGTDIYLTVDKYIQASAESYLADAIKKYSADSGQVIVMDKTNGRILAMANGPTFNPNKYTEEKDLSVFMNRAITDNYEPGSVFKAVTMAAGLDSGKINTDTKYTDYGYVMVDGVKINNSHPKANGLVGMSFVLEQSLNTGTTFIQQKMGKSLFYNYVKKFGFGKITGIEGDNEAAGAVYGPDKVGDVGYATMSFGQGLSCSPLQMLSAFATIANGGEMVRPYMIEKTVDAKGKATKTNSKKLGQIITKKSADDTTKMLIQVVEKGHGYQAKVAGYKIAGKTGTAQVPKADGSGYEENKNVGTFIGYPVAENANFVVMAKIDNAKGVPWAEESAAPVVGQMLSFLLKYYQIPPTEAVAQN